MNTTNIPHRISGIDVTRGMVMVIMALDHTRDLLHVHSLTQNPTDLSITTPLLFFTRWITHLCAPTFVFLAGTSAYLYLQRHGEPETRKFLISRGLLLILLEFTLVNFAMWFDFHFRTLLFGVIATIGIGLALLGLLIRVRSGYLAIAGIIILTLQGLIPSIAFDEGSSLKNILNLLFSITVLPFGQRVFGIVYPPLPWLGILLTGFAAGALFTATSPVRKKSLVVIGAGLLVAFVAIRFINVYGDAPWSIQKNGLFTFLSFINLTKYPPSLLFALSMSAITCLMLGYSENIKGRITDWLSVYGRTSFFYFVMHFVLLHLILIGVVLWQGYHFSDMNFGAFGLGRPKGESGVALGAVYIIWISVVLLMYPLCRMYGTYKSSHPEKKWLTFF